MKIYKHFCKIYLKKEGIMEKNSYERLDYESVDNKSLSYAISQYSKEKSLSSNGLSTSRWMG